MSDEFLANLNPQQKDAVTYAEGPSLVLAGAGSGKTRVLTSKVLNLIKTHNVDPLTIAMMTFTNKSAGVMQSRVGHKLGFIGTFHSFSAIVLRRDGGYVGLTPSYVIYDDDDCEALIKKILKELNPIQKITPSMVKYRISSAKDNLLNPEEFGRFANDGMDQFIALIYEKYQKRLEKNNAVDFDDLIFKTVVLFRENKKVLEKYNEHYQHVLVDEFQDTNAGQYQLAKYLAGPKQNITVVGDFSQSIYSWRGADIKNLEKFQKDFPSAKVVYLEQNYRSTQKVLNFAYDIITQNQSHPVLKLFTDNDEGEEIDIKQLGSEQDEGIFIAEEIDRLVRSGKAKHTDFAVLFRINAQSRIVEESFLHYGIPYVLIGGTRFYERKEIKDILAYIRLLVNAEDEISLARVKKIGKRKYEAFTHLYKEVAPQAKEFSTDELIQKIFSATSYLDFYDQENPDDAARLENIKELRSVAVRFPDVNEFLQQIALVESEYSQQEKDLKGKSGVHLMTLHQAKGMEFPYVFIIGLEEGILPHSRALYDKQELEEERRLLYVGITRAEKKLYLTHVERRFIFGKRMFAQISRFIDDNPDEFNGGGADDGNYIRSF